MVNEYENTSSNQMNQGFKNQPLTQMDEEPLQHPVLASSEVVVGHSVNDVALHITASNISQEEKIQQLVSLIKSFPQNVDTYLQVPVQKQKMSQQMILQQIKETMDEYSVKEHPSRQEVDHLKKIIGELAEALRMLKEEQDKSMKEKDQEIMLLMEEMQKLINQYIELQKMMSQLAKVNINKPKQLEGGKGGRCLICGSEKHPAKVCYQFEDAATRRVEMNREGTCHKCLNGSHSEDQCPKKGPCGHCKQGHHHEALCYVYCSREQVVLHRIKFMKKLGESEKREEEIVASNGAGVSGEDEH